MTSPPAASDGPHNATRRGSSPGPRSLGLATVGHRSTLTPYVAVRQRHTRARGLVVGSIVAGLAVAGTLTCHAEKILLAGWARPVRGRQRGFRHVRFEVDRVVPPVARAAPTDA
ncbi:hypothetical protein ACFPM0_28045 [Pseudonocardia sulfidoxydans]|uniref:hypothetical protein n=1 Tax=Pseudonocardia sulfidoxydans TaxID=54011 RepID=UPI0036114A6E